MDASCVSTTTASQPGFAWTATCHSAATSGSRPRNAQAETPIAPNIAARPARRIHRRRADGGGAGGDVVGGGGGGGGRAWGGGGGGGVRSRGAPRGGLARQTSHAWARIPRAR